MCFWQRKEASNLSATEVRASVWGTFLEQALLIRLTTLYERGASKLLTCQCVTEENSLK